MILPFLTKALIPTRPSHITRGNQQCVPAVTPDENRPSNGKARELTSNESDSLISPPFSPVEHLWGVPALLKIAILYFGGLVTASDPGFDICVKNEQEGDT